jgi:4-hydroxy-tetrahydrodipicolinate synthase
MMEKISRVFTSLVTPFTLEGALNEDRLRGLIRFQVAAGVQGIVILGTTGEAPTLTPGEKEKIITIARKETFGKVHLMVGTGAYSTAATIENTLLAQSLGADSVLIVAPYYNKPTQEGLFQHYKAIADAADIPMMVYNIQGRTAVNIQTETLLRIAGLPGICGVKEASGNIQQIGEVIEKIGRTFPNFSVMCGDDALTFPSMVLGGDGIISVLSNLIPHQMCTLTQSILNSEYEQARDLHYALMPLFRAIFIETNPIPIKAAMQGSGIDAGSCRLPLCLLSSENENQLKKLLTTAPFARFIAQHQDLFNISSASLSGSAISN